MKKILVPTDFSKEAQIALDVASQIAKKANAEIVLLHVIEDVTSDSFNVEGQIDNADHWEDRIFIKKLIERSKLQLSQSAEVVHQAGVGVSQEIRMGTPFNGIHRIISEQNVDLVVMGTAGLTKLEEMIIGSNTEKVVRHSNCPVLSVHEKPASTNFKNIVYATSMSEDEVAFSRVVRNMQERYDATVHMVRINTPGNFQRDAIVKKNMGDFAKKLQLKNYTLNVFNDLSEEEGIIYFADSINADLIAMATHGRTGFAHVLAGSIAEDVVSHATRPVLTFVTKKKN